MEPWKLFFGTYKVQGWESRSSGRTKRLPDHRVSGKDRRTRDLRVGVILSTSPHGINCANRIVHLSALPDSGRATRGLWVSTTWKRRADEGLLGEGIPLPFCLPDDTTGLLPGPTGMNVAMM
jgi:hypothetical protein